MLKYYVIFVYILQGKMGKMEKNRKTIMQLKWPKTKRQKSGMSKTYIYIAKLLNIWVSWQNKKKSDFYRNELKAFTQQRKYVKVFTIAILQDFFLHNTGRASNLETFSF
jgi:hypothetical protein